MSIKNSNDTIGNRTRDLPTCSAVPQPTGYYGIACHKNGSNMSLSQRFRYETKIKLAAHSCALELQGYVQRPNEFATLEYPFHEEGP